MAWIAKSPCQGPSSKGNTIARIYQHARGIRLRLPFDVPSVRRPRI
jgi:hypothetical protein